MHWGYLLMVFDRIPVRLRLALGHTLWMAALFGATGFGLLQFVERSIYQSADAALIESASMIRDASFDPAVEKWGGYRRALYWHAVLDDIYGQQRYMPRMYAQIIDNSGKIIAKTMNVRVSLPVTLHALTRAEAGLDTFESFTNRPLSLLRQITLPILWNGTFTGGLIQVGMSMDASAQVLASVRNMLWIALSMGFVLSIGFGYLLTSWSLKPVTRIIKEASVLSASNLHTRLKAPAAKDELRVLTDTLNEMLDRMEDAFIRLNRFPSDVSHELRTPLSVVKGEAELALRKERSVDQYKDALGVILSEANDMSFIVEDLLLLARAKGNLIAAKWEDVPFAPFVEELQRSVLRPFSEKSVSLLIYNSVDISVNISPIYFTLAVKNILLNACKHSRRGSKVELISRINRDNLEILVRDYGEGIPKEAQPHIFDAFYRVDTARNRAEGGVGIGLSLAHALIKMHEGDVIVESDVGKGAIFSIRVPLRRKSPN